MKNIVVAAVLFLAGVCALNAQDLIILKDGNTIEAKVEEISQTEIKYKRFDHLDGPTIVVSATNVLSIRYANGRTDIINAQSQPTAASAQAQTPAPLANLPRRNARLNTFGGSVGYMGISNFGFNVNGTVSPADYTFFDFNLGLGFNNFSFNGNASFAGFVPFNNGGWYGGIGLGGGVYEHGDSMNGFFAVNALTGFIFFNWLNISATLQMEVVPEFDIRFKPMVGYVYRFDSQQDYADGTETRQPKEKKPPRELVAHHWISIEPAFAMLDLLYRIGFEIGVNYQYQITPQFAIGANIHYRDDNWSSDEYNNRAGKDFSLIANGYWYPSSRIFFLKLGLGWNHNQYQSQWENALGILTYYSYVSNGFIISPGFGWTIDIGEPGGFFISTGLEIPLVLGKENSERRYGTNLYRYEDRFMNLDIRVFIGIGYAF